MIPRYSRPRMTELWSDAKRLDTWLEVELCACEAMAEAGLVPQQAAENLRKRCFRFNESHIRRVAEIEERCRHDIIAFLTFLEEELGPEARWLHKGLTSSDILDTSFALLLKQAAQVIEEDLDQLRKALAEQAERHKYTPMIGRTHGVHAEPTTFGLVLALWWAELGRQAERLRVAKKSIAVGKLSGAVGTFAHLPPSIEERVCRRLGLEPAPISNQVIQRDRHAEFFYALANLGATIEKIAVNLRHLQRTEVGEVLEPFASGQKGSSAMPHKRNPIGLENLTGVARLLRAYAQAALENVALWHERDISHSSVERVIGPDATTLADYALHRLHGIVSKMQVDTERMHRNLELTRGLVYSQVVLLKLVEAGLERQQAYEKVQRAALAAWQGPQDLLTLLRADPEITARLPEAELVRCFDPRSMLQRVDQIWERVFGRRS